MQNIKVNNVISKDGKILAEGVFVKYKDSGIIVSYTEKIEVGDWYYDPTRHRIGKCKRFSTEKALIFDEEGASEYTSVCRKILALPKHFSPQQLQMIVDGRLKDGDKVLVECEKLLCDIQGNPIKNVRIDALSVIYENEKAEIMASIIQYQIKLNPHITIYPVEKGVYTREEVFIILQKFHDTPIYSGTDMSSYLHKWFEQNVK